MGLKRFSSRDIPSGQRAARYGEILNSILNLEVTSLDDAPLEVDTSMRVFPGGLVVARSDLSPLSMNRTAQHAADGNDNFILSLPVSEGALYRIGDREFFCKPGEALMFPGDEPSLIANRAMSRLSLSIPRGLLEAGSQTPVIIDRFHLQNGPALVLLASYANALTQDSLDLPETLEALAASHIRDLIVAALQPGKPEHAEIRSGVRAARLSAIKNRVRRSLHRHDLSLDDIARGHGISPRYVQSLFRDEGMTFRDFVLTERLRRAHAKLCDPASDGARIGEIAFACGFGDLSYFNYAFRRRFGMTPGDVRRMRSS